MTGRRTGRGRWGPTPHWIAWGISAATCGVGAACGFSEGRDRGAFEREDSAGVEVVRMLRAPDDTVRLNAPAVRIGSTGLGGAEAEVFELLSDVVILPDGRIVVVDNRGGRVAAFDSAGSWLYDIGRRGEGPGEHTAPIYASTRADSLFVWDAIQRRLSRYTADGAFLGSITLSERTSAHPFAAIDGGYAEFVESGQLMDPAPARGALIRRGRDGALLDTLVGPYPVPERGWVVTDEQSGAGRMTNPPALSIYPPWTVHDGALVRNHPNTAVVEVRSLATGRVVRLIRLPYEAAPPGEVEREAYFRSLQARLELSEEAIARERAGTEFVEVRPPVAGTIVDDRGRLWIAEHDPAAWDRGHIGVAWDVLDPGRDRAVRVIFPEGFELQAVEGARAYGTTTLESGVQVVDVFHHELGSPEA